VEMGRTMAGVLEARTALNALGLVCHRIGTNIGVLSEHGHEHADTTKLSDSQLVSKNCTQCSQWQYSTPKLTVTPADALSRHICCCCHTFTVTPRGQRSVQQQSRSGANGATEENKSGPFANDNLGSVEWAMETFPSPRTPPTPPTHQFLQRDAKTRWLQQELQTAAGCWSLSLCSFCRGLSQDTFQSTHCRCSISPLARTTVQVLTAVRLRIHVFYDPTPFSFTRGSCTVANPLPLRTPQQLQDAFTTKLRNVALHKT
jgi:hypothetical protein